MYQEQGASAWKTPLVLLLNALVGFFFGLCLLLVSSVMIWAEWLPETAVNWIPAAVGLLSCVLSAYLSGKQLGRGLVFGIIHGIVQYALSYLTGLLVFLRLAPSTWELKLLLCCLIGGLLGGILSATRIRLKRY